jgi:hypothetical protein
LNRTRRIDRAANIFGDDFPIATRDSDDCLTVEAEDVRARQVDGHLFRFEPAHAFRFFDGFLDRVDCCIRIYDHSLAQPASFGFSDSNHFEQIPFTRFTSNTRHLARPNVETDRVLCSLSHVGS